jgi:uncharacterized membrane protein
MHVPFTVPERSTSPVPPSGSDVVPCSTAASENVAVSPVTVKENDVTVNEPHGAFAATLAVVPVTDHARVQEADGSDVVVDDRVPPSLATKSKVAVSLNPLFVVNGHVHVPANGLAGVVGAPLPLELEQAAAMAAKRASDQAYRGNPATTTSRVTHPRHASKGPPALQRARRPPIPCQAHDARRPRNAARRTMTKGRLEAFSDGVLAVIITIMALELKVPHGDDLHALDEEIPIFLAYVLSFVYVGIYWNNHHHLFHATRRISGSVMWANLHLLFWLSLLPVATGWVGANPSASWPAALYGALQLMAALAWAILVKRIIAVNGRDSELAQAVASGTKEKISPVIYATAIGLAFVKPWVADALYAVVGIIWIVPDRRIESRVTGEPGD